MMNDLKRKKRGVAPVKAIDHLKIYPCTQISHGIGVRLGTILIWDRKSDETECIVVKL